MRQYQIKTPLTVCYHRNRHHLVLPAAQICFSTSANQTHRQKQKRWTNQHLIMCVVCVCVAGRCRRRTSRLRWEFSTCCSECSVSPHIVPFEQGTSGLWCKGTVHTESETSVVTSSLHADSFISFPSPDFFFMTPNLSPFPL